MDAIQRVPFFRLLLPLLAGIVIQYYTDIYRWSIIPFSIGAGMMLFSLFIKQQAQYKWRHLFGIGACFVLFAIGIISTMFRQEASRFTFPDITEVYEGIIIDLPQEKPSTIAIKVKLTESGKQIICYLPKSGSAKWLKPGEYISFFSKVTPFTSNGNPDRFDYSQFMRNKGYSGISFIKSDQWEIVDKEPSLNLFTLASRSRQNILLFFQSLELNESEYGILAALTLGYTDSLSDDVVQSFRATGTAHVLAISGMHMMILFSIFLGVSGILFSHSKVKSFRYPSIILLLWVYTFIIGFPPSAVRACIMLTMLCVSVIVNSRTYSFNTLLACAFVMLIWNPLWLFDLGFQLSFIAVLSMMVLLPMFSKLIVFKNKYIKYFRDLFTVSLAAQLGTLPLCLYYFGTFPSYFFVTNLIIVPLISLAIYIIIIIAVVAIPALIFPAIAPALYYLPVSAFRIVIKLLTEVSFFFEKLPFAVSDNLNISLPSVFILWTMIFSFIFFVKSGKPKLLITSLTSLLILFCIGLSGLLQNKDSLIVYNNKNSTDIIYYIDYRKFSINEKEDNRILNLKGKTYLLLSDDRWKNTRATSSKMQLDYLHIAENNAVSLYTLSRIFNIKKVIIDGSISGYNSKRLMSECEKLRIPYYDISENGALRIFF